VEVDPTRVRASMIETARFLQAEACAARERARQMLVEDGARRIRLRSRSRAVEGPGSSDSPCPTSEPSGFTVCSDVATPSRLVLRTAGEIDMATAPAFAEALQVHLQAGEPGTELIVDLTDLTFIDVRGLAALLAAAEAARARDVVFRVVGRPRCLLRLVDLTDTRDALNLPQGSGG
jgi:anti-anti-sigma factor